MDVLVGDGLARVGEGVTMDGVATVFVGDCVRGVGVGVLGAGKAAGGSKEQPESTAVSKMDTSKSTMKENRTI